MVFLVNENYGESSIVRFSNEVLHREGIQYTGTATITRLAFVPIPAAIWLLGSSLVGLALVFKKNKI